MTPLLDVAEVSKLFPAAGGPGPWARTKRRFSGGPANLPKVYAVDDVSFVIGKGETVGLVGKSGCGKSTLVRALTRLIDVSDGTIKLGDRELARKTSRSSLVIAIAPTFRWCSRMPAKASTRASPHSMLSPTHYAGLRKLRGKALQERVAVARGNATAGRTAVALSASAFRRPARARRHRPRDRGRARPSGA